MEVMPAQVRAVHIDLGSSCAVVPCKKLEEQRIHRIVRTIELGRLTQPQGPRTGGKGSSPAVNKCGATTKPVATTTYG
jgi:hypothetical protein